MKDRLIELLEKAEKKAGEYIKENDHMDYIPTLKELLGVYADCLLSDGVIVPPCKVGDIAYSYTHSWRKEDGIWRKEDGISPYQITNITITQNKKGEWTKKYRAMEVKNGKTIDNQLNFAFDEIGKTVFLTREEAEQALKGEDTDNARG